MAAPLLVVRGQCTRTRSSVGRLVQLTGAVGAAVVDDHEFHVALVVDLEDSFDRRGQCVDSL